MISASAFRDKILKSLTISYDWVASDHFADIGVADQSGSVETYRITGLSGFSVDENFAAMHIEQCTLTMSPGRAYLSLDPFTEGAESEKDNYCFVGSAIRVSG